MATNEKKTPTVIHDITPFRLCGMPLSIRERRNTGMHGVTDMKFPCKGGSINTASDGDETFYSPHPSRFHVDEYTDDRGCHSEDTGVKYLHRPAAEGHCSRLGKFECEWVRDGSRWI